MPLTEGDAAGAALTVGIKSGSKYLLFQLELLSTLGQLSVIVLNHHLGNILNGPNCLKLEQES